MGHGSGLKKGQFTLGLGPLHVGRPSAHGLHAHQADDPQQFGVASQALQQVTPKLQALMREYGMTVCGAAG